MIHGTHENFTRLIGCFLCLFLGVTLAVILPVLRCNAADNTYWQMLSFEKSTPNGLVLMFGPPALIKTEERYSEWKKNQATGCGQTSIYAMNYTNYTGDLNILKGPLGKASEVDLWIDKGKLSAVEWIYDGNQLEPAVSQWLNHQSLTPVVTKKPGVVMVGTWKPKNGRFLAATCFNGGEGPICKGPITVYYSADTEK